MVLINSFRPFQLPGKKTISTKSGQKLLKINILDGIRFSRLWTAAETCEYLIWLERLKQTKTSKMLGNLINRIVLLSKNIFYILDGGFGFCFTITFYQWHPELLNITAKVYDNCNADQIYQEIDSRFYHAGIL